MVERVLRLNENAVLTGEASDEHGPYKLVFRIEGEKPGEFTECYYTRKGTHAPNIAATKTAIDLVFYEDDQPVGANPIATYDEATGVWEDVK